MSNSQLNKFKSRIKNGIQVILNSSYDMTGNSNDMTNFPPKLLWIHGQIWRLLRAFANKSSANIKLSKTEMPIIGQLEDF